MVIAWSCDRSTWSPEENDPTPLERTRYMFSFPKPFEHSVKGQSSCRITIAKSTLWSSPSQTPSIACPFHSVDSKRIEDQDSHSPLSEEMSGAKSMRFPRRSSAKLEALDQSLSLMLRLWSWVVWTEALFA